MLELALLALVATSTNVEVTTIGEVAPAFHDTLERELDAAFVELTKPARTSDILSITLVAGASKVHCIATRKSTGETIELDLSIGALTFRPGIDEVVRRLYPELIRVSHRTTIPTPNVTLPPEPAFDVAPLIALGASAALLTGGIVLGASASSASDRLEADPMSSMEFRDTLNSAHTRAVAADVLFVSAAISAVVTAALFLR